MIGVLADNWDYLLFAVASLCIVGVLGVWVWHRPGERGIISVAAMLVAGVVGAGWFGVDAAGKKEYGRLRTMVEGLAPTYAFELAQMGHSAITLDTPVDDPVYLRMIEQQKKWLMLNPIVSDIYTFRRLENGAVVLVVDSETDYNHDGVYEGERESRTSIGEVYEEADEQMLRAFTGEATFSDVPVTDRWGAWVSAQVPMYDPQGRVEAVCGVDYPAEDWVGAIRTARRKVIVYLGVVEVFIVIGAVTVGYFREDIAKRKITEAQLRKAKEATDIAYRTKSEFLANVSHEIRTPLTAILGNVDMMLEPTISAEERMRCVSAIQRNGAHLSDLINDILDLSKLEAGKMQVEQVVFSPFEVIAAVADMMRQRAVQKGLAFEVEYMGAIPKTIRSDPTRLRQILVNLVGNAIKFTEHGGVRVITRLVDTDTQQPRLRVEVVDSGIGMTQEQQQRLFEAFTQGDNTTTRKYGGTGLGLMISLRLAKMLGGAIKANSIYGHGSSFVVTVQTGPLEGVEMIQRPREAMAESEFGQDEADAGGNAAGLEGVRVLVAEDGQDNQRLISFLLGRKGAEVEIAENGRKAYAKAMEAVKIGRRYDVILMDMQMPELDGYGATSLLRSQGYKGPIVALTAHAMTGDRKKCLQVGCDDYTTKPINKSKLIEMIASQAARGTMIVETEMEAVGEGL